MNKTPLDKIIGRATQSVADSLQYAHIGYKTESPIESLLLSAVIAGVRYQEITSEHLFNDILVADIGTEPWFREDRMCIVVQCQAPVLNYRVDFLVHVRNLDAGKWVALVVECDGHDFHERTKEQAAKDRSRDRAMQEAGYPVFRFTGSEIYRDPCKCADQILTWADKAFFG